LCNYYEPDYHFIIDILPNGTITTKSDDHIVPQSVLSDINIWITEGISMKDIIDRLRPRTVLSGYEFHTWTPGKINIGKSEDFEDKLRSILAQFHYVQEIEKYEAKGIPFKTYMYIPEHHPETNDLFSMKGRMKHI